MVNVFLVYENSRKSDAEFIMFNITVIKKIKKTSVMYYFSFL